MYHKVRKIALLRKRIHVLFCSLLASYEAEKKRHQWCFPNTVIIDGA